jgi:hypothetical protein
LYRFQHCQIQSVTRPEETDEIGLQLYCKKFRTVRLQTEVRLEQTEKGLHVYGMDFEILRPSPTAEWIRLK